MHNYVESTRWQKISMMLIPQLAVEDHKVKHINLLILKISFLTLFGLTIYLGMESK